MAMAALSRRLHRLDRALTAVLADPWIHWTYSRPQWEAWTEQQVARMAALQEKMTYGALIRAAVIMFLLLGMPSCICLSQSHCVALDSCWGILSVVAAGTVCPAVYVAGPCAGNLSKSCSQPSLKPSSHPTASSSTASTERGLAPEIYLLAASIEQTNSAVRVHAVRTGASRERWHRNPPGQKDGHDSSRRRCRPGQTPEEPLRQRATRRGYRSHSLQQFARPGRLRYRGWVAQASPIASGCILKSLDESC